MIRFAFELRPLAAIRPWTDARGEDPHLSWFGLTDGWCWIETGQEQLFRYDDATLSTWRAEGFEAGRPYVDYQVVRLWEDALAVLPHVLEPVPDVLRSFVARDPFERLGRPRIPRGGRGTPVAGQSRARHRLPHRRPRHLVVARNGLERRRRAHAVVSPETR
jgi:hypothetical protein